MPGPLILQLIMPPRLSMARVPTLIMTQAINQALALLQQDQSVVEPVQLWMVDSKSLIRVTIEALKWHGEMPK